MGVIASQITSLTIVHSAVYSDADQRKHQSSASLPFVLGTHRGPVNSPHKWPVTQKIYPLDDVGMINSIVTTVTHKYSVHKSNHTFVVIRTWKQRFMGPKWGPSRADRTQTGPMLAPWILLSGDILDQYYTNFKIIMCMTLLPYILYVDNAVKSWLQMCWPCEM